MKPWEGWAAKLAIFYGKRRDIPETYPGIRHSIILQRKTDFGRARGKKALRPEVCNEMNSHPIGEDG